MISIICSSAAPHHLEELRAWCLAEWGNADQFESNIDGMVVPPAVLAVDGGVLAGGLVFTAYPKPGRDDLGLWVNALFVAPERRGLGIASKLIRAGEVDAYRQGESELFAYTNIPDLYRKSGWETVKVQNEHEVLRKVLMNG